MKLEKTCDTCYDNHRGCSYMQSAKCVENGYFDWEPYTNYDRIMEMNADELAEWISEINEVPKSLIVTWLNSRVEVD